jgi:hypothetical protein
MGSKKTGKKGRGILSPAFQSIEELNRAVDRYFKECEGELALDMSGKPLFEKGNPVYQKPPSQPTVSGLACALGLSRTELLAISADDEGKTIPKGFYYAVSLARGRVEEAAETALFSRESAKGAEFSLKNNFGWDRDQQPDGGQMLSDADREMLLNIAQRMEADLNQKDYSMEEMDSAEGPVS